MNEQQMVARCQEVDKAYQRLRSRLGRAVDPWPAQELARARGIAGRSRRIDRLRSLSSGEWEIYVNALYAVCFGRLKRGLCGRFGHHVAEEAAQTALVKFNYHFGVTHPEQFDASRDPEPWLVTAARNAAIDLVRQQRRRGEHEFSRDVEGCPEEWHGCSDDCPEDEAIEGLAESTEIRGEMVRFVERVKGRRWAQWFGQVLDSEAPASVMRDAVRESLGRAPATAVNGAGALDDWWASFPAPRSAKGVFMDVLDGAPRDTTVRDVVTLRYLTPTPSAEAVAEVRKVERASEVAMGRVIRMVRREFGGDAPGPGAR